MLDGNPNALFEEVGILENAISQCFNHMSHTPLTQATTADVANVLNGFVKEVSRRHGSSDHPIMLYKNALDESKKEIINFFLVIGRLQRLRSLLESHLVISFVGVHNAGKSSCISNLFGFETHADALQRTESLVLYKLQSSPTSSEPTSLRISVADFPGSTDERPQIAQLTAKLGDVSSLFVCVFSAGHIAAPERHVMDIVQAKGRDFVVLINKCDILGAELQQRYSEFKTNYSRVLNVPEDRIFFTSMNEPERVEAVRCIIFTHLRSLVKDSEENDLTSLILHPKFRAQLPALQTAISASDKEVISACAVFLQNNQLISIARVEKYLNHTKQARPVLSRMHSLKEQTAVNLEARLIQPLIDMGFERQLIVMTFDFFSSPRDADANPIDLTESDTDEAQKSEHAREMSKLLQAFHQLQFKGAHHSALPGVLQVVYDALMAVMTSIQSTYDILIGKGYPQKLVLWALRKSLYNQNVEVDGVEALIEKRIKENMSLQDDALAVSFIDRSEMLLKGSEQLSLLLHGVRISGVPANAHPPRPLAVYPDFKDTMDLDTRLNMFMAKCAYRISQVEETYTSTTNIDISTTHLLDTMVKELYDLSPNQLKGRLKANLIDSEGIDAGGVIRGAFTGLAQQIREGKSEFFDVLDTQEIYFGLKGYLQPDKARIAYRAIGRAVGLSLWRKGDNISFPVPFSLAVFKLILGQPIGLKDLDIMREQVSSSIKQVCLIDGDSVEDLGLVFSIGISEQQSYPLVSNGDDVPVTDFNRFQYTLQSANFYLGAHLPLRDFVQGVHDACPWELLSIFTPQMLQVLVCGESSFTADDLQKNSTLFSSSPPSPKVTLWFWNTVRGMSDQGESMLR